MKLKVDDIVTVRYGTSVIDGRRLELQVQVTEVRENGTESSEPHYVSRIVGFHNETHRFYFNDDHIVQS